MSSAYRGAALAILVGALASGCARHVSADRRPASNATQSTPEVPLLDHPPPSRRDRVADVMHGVTVSDPYRWLEDSRSSDVAHWTEAQDAYARHYLDSLPERRALVSRLSELLYVADTDIVVARAGRQFFRRRGPREDKYRLYVRVGSRGQERLLFDPTALPAEEHVALQRYWPARDGKYVAVQISKNNTDDSRLYILRSDSGELVDTVEGARYNTVLWGADSASIYYTWYPSGPETSFARSEVKLHIIGQKTEKDHILSPATGRSDLEQYVIPSSDGRWLILHKALGWRRTELYFAKGDSPTTVWHPLAVTTDARYSATPYDGKFYIWTNEGAPRRHIFRVDPATPDRSRWDEIVRERSDATLDSFDIVGDRVAVRWVKDAATELEMYSLDGRVSKAVSLPGIGLVANLDGLEHGDEVFFRYESHIQAPRIYRLSASTGDASLIAGVAPLTNESEYVAENVPFQSKDGTRSFIVVMHHKGLKPDGSAPAYLTGYGAHGISMQATYLPSTYAWLEQGGVYARAVVRGGGEYGEDWHRQGMLIKKQNSVDDFIAAAEELVRLGWTRPDRLAISGSSMGGLLVAAAVTQRPDLFRAAICEAPLTDLVRYPLSGAGKSWVSELGDPDKVDEFTALWGYSPYHHVERGVRYPPVLVMASDSDDRVDGSHARKFVAALQASPRSGPALLTVARNQGHNASDSVDQLLNIRADKFAFALAQIHGRDGAPRPALSTTSAEGKHEK